jgi:hypothetical protein
MGHALPGEPGADGTETGVDAREVLGHVAKDNLRLRKELAFYETTEKGQLRAQNAKLLEALKESLQWLGALHEQWRCATEMREKDCRHCQAKVKARAIIEEVEKA